ncbi:hypothetical protein HDU97_005706 [Phlyctochytrium planicorne]|nr:hypothetical protein HDU97_005706 [Phlyctochytrium planicorne]
MLVTRIIAIASIIAGAAAKLAIRSPKTANTLDGVYMVEVQNGADAEALVRSHLEPAGFHADDIVGRLHIKTALFTGFSFSIQKPHDEDLVAAIPQIKNVFRISKVAAPNPIKTASAPSNSFAPEDFHSLTGVNTIREKLGLTGKGIKVAIIDTGIDYNHEALGGGFGPGYKVSFGYDLVGDDYELNKAPVPDADPLDNCSSISHGTHVAGIVAANSFNLTNPEWVSDLPFTGVAPDVTLGAYRIFGCNEGFTSSDIIAAAIYKAAEDDADIINLSLAGDLNFNDAPDSVAATRVSDAGHLVVASNGNDAAAGLFTGSAPANAVGAIAVASFDNAAVPKQYFLFEGTKYEFNLADNNNNWNYSTSYEVVANDINADDTDSQDDGKGAINPAVGGKIALIRWGQSQGSNLRCSNAARAGAVGCIIYSNTGVVPDIAGSTLIPSLATSHDAGKAIVAALKKSTDQTTSVTITTGLINTKLPTGGYVSSFSSSGLDQELFIKPDVGAIGGQVYSTISKHSQGVGSHKTPYTILSGTSMASPYTVGVVALLLQSYGRNRPTITELRTVLQNTATVVNRYESNLVESVVNQGAGLINAYRAAISKTTVFPSNLALNDTQYTKQHYSLTVTNKNSVAINYTVKHLPAAIAAPFVANEDALVARDEVEYTADYATVKFSKNNDRLDALEFTLAAGESKSFNVHFQAPRNAAAGLLPVFSGYIVVNGDGDKVASVPYAGMVGKWRDAPVLVKKSPRFDDFLRNKVIDPIASQYNINIANNATFTTGVFDVNGDFTKPISEGQKFNLTSTPVFVLPIAATTSRALRVEAIYKGADWTPLKSLGIDRFTQLHISGRTLGLTPDFATGELGAISAYITTATIFPVPMNTYVRSQYIYGPTATFWQGFVRTNASDPNAALVKLPAGKYQIRIAGLKHFGRTNAPVGGEDYDTVLSNSFEIFY